MRRSSMFADIGAVFLVAGATLAPVLVLGLTVAALA